MCWSSTVFTNTTSRTAVSLICRSKSLCSGKGSFELCWNSTFVFNSGTLVLFRPSVSVSDAAPVTAISSLRLRLATRHVASHVLSRNSAPAFDDRLLYMLKFCNHSVCPIFIWGHFMLIHWSITSNAICTCHSFMCPSAFLLCSTSPVNFCVIRDHSSFPKRC